jgi:quercetin dioxygenase-like cupin family protein
MNTPKLNAPAYSVVGDRYIFLRTGSDTGGTHSVFEFYVPAGSGSPPHVHHNEDEAFYVVDGEFEFTVAGESMRVAAGGFIFGRRGVPHNFKNIGATHGRMVVTVTPAGLEDFFSECGARLDSPDSAPIPPTPEDIEKLVRTAPKYGLEIFLPHK